MFVRPRAAPSRIQTSQIVKAMRISRIGVSQEIDGTMRKSSGMPKAVTIWKAEKATAIQNSRRPFQPSPKVAGRPCSGSYGAAGAVPAVSGTARGLLVSLLMLVPHPRRACARSFAHPITKAGPVIRPRS